MESESLGKFSKSRWIFMYSIWGFAELTSIAAVVYSIYSVIILILGNWVGAAVFVGIIPGFVMLPASFYLFMLTKIPWRAGDYQIELPCIDCQVRRVGLFHTILWSDERSEAQPHMDVCLHKLEPRDKKDEFFVYGHHGVTGFEFYGRWRWLAYAWAISCEIIVLAALALSAWFMIWAGIEASISFLSGSLLPSVGLAIRCSYYIRKYPLLPNVHVAGPTWVIKEHHNALHIRHFALYDLLLSA